MSETSKPMPKVQRRKVPGTYITSSDAARAFSRFVTLPNGEQNVIRFSRMQRLAHLLLIITITALAITGFSQTYYSTQIGSLILRALGGIDSTRQVHHIFAVMLLLQAAYHLIAFLRDLFTQNRSDKVWLDEKDLSQLFQLLGHNLGFAKSRPQFDRYSFEQKLHYWVFVLSIIILGGSGLMQWFPIIVSKYLPGWIIPIARAFHHWQAILTVAIILTWHFYQNVLRGFNRSIFSGLMSIDEMNRDHPLELLYLERAAAQINNTKWPRFISLAVEDVKEPAVLEAKPEPVVEVSAESELETIVELAPIVVAASEENQPEVAETSSETNASEEGQNG